MTWIWIWLTFLYDPAFAAKAVTKICDHIFLMEGELPLSRNERVMVCGAGDGPEGWRDVPLSQAEYQIRVFLQRRGFLNPRFEREGRQLRVWVGTREYIKRLAVSGAEGLLAPGEKRQVVGEAMTSEKLDEVSQWANFELRTHGYACPRVEVKAQVWDGSVIAQVQPGERARVGEIYMTSMNIDPQAVARYRTLFPGEWYDVRKTDLTAARMLADGLFQSAYFTHVCKGNKVDLTLNSTLGPPRLIRFGVGGSTEELLFTDLWFKSAKIDRRASSFTATTHVSPREQSLTVSSELYWVPWTSHSYFGPRFRFERESERNWEDLKAKAGLDLGRRWDWGDVRLRGLGGPTLNYVNTIRGLGPDDVSYLSWEGHISLMSHQYELFTRDQYEGWTTSVSYLGQRKGMGSPVNADRVEFDGKYLWNINHFSPPLFVLASRVEAIGTAARQNEIGATETQVPREYRVFYGGDQNLRGFNRKSIDNEGLGYLTAIYLGFELRLIEELPYRLQPFILWDGARLGLSSFTLEDALFTSWGGGLRWASPIGTLRGSAARGQIFNRQVLAQTYPEEWVYFFSFGQEF